MLLKLYDQNKQPIGFIRKITDLKIETDLEDADKQLSFTYLAKTHDIKNEYYIRTPTDEYVVKSIGGGKGEQQITAVLNVEELDGQPVTTLYIQNQPLEAAAELVLEGTGWTVKIEEEELAAKVRTINISKSDVYQVCKKLATAYFCEVYFDSLNKVVHYATQIGEDKGAYFISGLNLTSLDISRDSTDFYTQIYPVGKDGIDIKELNNGSNLLSNFQYSSKKRTYYWEDANYTDPAILMEDARRKLDDLSKPTEAYSVGIIDLAKQSEKYEILAYGIGDTVTLIDGNTGTRTKQRIKKLTEYPDNPEKNTCEIANTVLTFEEMQKKIQEASQIVEDLTENTGKVVGDKIYISVGGIDGEPDKWVTVSSLLTTEEGLESTVGKYYASIGEVTEIDQRLVQTETKATQTAEKFNWIVQSGSSSTDFTLTDRTAELIASYINLYGKVSFSGLDGTTQGKIQKAEDLANASMEDITNWCYNGNRTYIDGGKVYAGTVKAAQIDVNDLFAQNITATGTIQGATLIGGTIQGTVLSAATGNFTGTVTATDGKIGPWNVNSDAIWKGSASFGAAGAGNIYLGNSGFSLGNKLRYGTDGNLVVEGTVNATAGEISGNIFVGGSVYTREYADGYTVVTTINEGKVRVWRKEGNQTSIPSAGDGWVLLSAFGGFTETDDGRIECRTNGGLGFYVDGGQANTTTLRVFNDAQFQGPVRAPDGYSYTTTNNNPCVYVNSGGRLGRYASSSKRYKREIDRKASSVDCRKVLEIPVATYFYNPGYCYDDPEGKVLQIGFIAEDIDEIFPMACTYDDIGQPEAWNVNKLLPPILEVVKENDRRIEELESWKMEIIAEIAAMKAAQKGAQLC